MSISSLYGEHRHYRRAKYLLTISVIAVLSVGVSYILITVLDAYRVLMGSHLNAFFLSITIYSLTHVLLFGGFIGLIIVGIQKLLDSSHYGSGGNARFAGMFEEAFNRKSGKTALYYGRSLFSRSWWIFGRDDRHMLTIAGARSGKGASVIIQGCSTLII